MATRLETRLSRQALAAVGSSWLFFLAQDVLRLVSMMVLSRLLLPEDYGHFALAASVTGWLAGLGFSNFAPHILRERGEPAEVATYLLLGLALQTALALIGLAAAAALWFVWGRQLVATLVALAVFSLPVHVPAHIEIRLLQRDFHWYTLRLWQLLATLVGNGGAIVLAWSGAGPFALLIGIFTEPAVLALRMCLTRTVTRMVLKPDVLRRAWKFGLPMVGAHALGSGSSLLGTWAVGVVLGAEPLGFLNRALALAGLVFAKISGQASYPLLPVLARAHEDAGRRLRAGRLVLRVCVWTQLAVVGPAWLLAEPAIRIVYGERWLVIVPLMPWALAIALMNSVIVVLEPMVMAAGRTDLRLRWELGRFAGTVLSVGFLPFGLEAYLAAQAVLLSLVAVQAGWYAARVGWLDRSAVRDLLVSGVCMILSGATALIVLWNGETWSQRIVATLVYALAYAISLRLAAERELGELVEALPFGGRLKALLLLPAGAAASSFRSDV